MNAVATHPGRIAMRTMADRLMEEKRSYFRLLRYLLSEEVAAGYADPQSQPLPPRLADLLKQIEKHEQTPAR
jgi:hypothetical protein